MSLPTIEHPTYKLTLSIGEITYRPFVVKEQKIFMMAHESKDIESVIQAMKTIIGNCIIAPQVDIDALPLVDLTMLFIHLRARSMGETLKVYYKCNNPVESKECGMIIEGELNLLEVKPSGGEAYPKIMLTKDIGVHMHYPSFDLLNLAIKVPTMDSEFMMIAGCIDYVWDAKGMHKMSEATPEEALKFVTELPEAKYRLLKQFLETAPTVKETLYLICPQCHFKHECVLEGLSDFFV